MKGKVVLSLFALPVLGVGVWMLFSIGGNLIDASRMRSWEPVQAQLTRGGYQRHSGGESGTYEAYAEYTYRFGGRDYTGKRVGIAGGADNVGDYHTQLGNRLSEASSRGEAIQIYVNANDPSEAIIDRDPRWGMIGFKAIFLLTFGGFGVAMIVFLVRAAKPKDASQPIYRERPWLINDAWQTATVKSNSKATMYFTWGFAAFWNLISTPLPFVMYQEIFEKENYLGLIALLFPMVGIGLMVWAIRRTLEWRRFGPAPVTLDPYPGAIGGHVGGTIDVNLPYDANAKFPLTLTNIYSYRSGSGRNRSRRERAEWQDAQLAHTEHGMNGTRLSFRFELPEGLNQSEVQSTADNYHVWRLNLKAALPGTDIDRDYEIPVYNTGEKSRLLSERIVESARAEKERIDDIAIRAKIGLRRSSQGTELYYPVGRNIGPALTSMLFGAIFGGAGWFLIFSEEHDIFGGLFAGIGMLIILAGLYTALNSLQVLQDSVHLRSVRRLLGVPVRRGEIRRDEFVRFSKNSSFQTKSGSAHVMHYSIYAEDGSGKKIVIGEGFKGESEAKAAIRFVSRAFALTQRD